MLHLTGRKLYALLIVLFLSSPGLAWGRSEHRAYAELQRMRLQWQREAERLDKLRRGRTHQRFQFDVF
jgi:hypothetical protein